MKNKALFIKTIKSDCAIRSRYINADGETCAIGALALAAGCTEAQLRKAGDKRIGHLCAIPLAIRKKFDLDLEDMSRIQTENDWNDTSAARRSAILEYIKTL